MVVGVSYSPAASAFNPSSNNPGGVRRRNGDCTLTGGVTINGLLVVSGNLRVNGQNTITAVKNFPALIIGGDLIVEPGAQFQINGLAVVHGQIQVSAAARDLDVLGGLFTQDSLFEAITDSSGNSHTGSTYGGPTWRPSGGRTAGAPGRTPDVGA